MATNQTTGRRAVGPAQPGSGRKRLPPEVARSQPIRLLVTQGQREDLQTIADEWGVGAATVVFAFVAKELAEIRRMQLVLDPLGLSTVAAMRMLEAQAKRQPDL